MTSRLLQLHKGFVVLLMSVLLTSCGSSDIYNQYDTFADNNWHFDSISRFAVEVKDTSLHYNVFVNLRHTEEYTYQNFWLFVESIGADSMLHRDTIGVEVADMYGKWRGAGSASMFQLAVPLSLNQQFAKPGIYQYALRHGMRDTVLSGIKNIGIRIEKTY